MKRNDIEHDLQIDEFNLDREWVAQPKLCFQYGANLADAKRDLDREKTELELFKAETDQVLRLAAVHAGVKTTEKRIESEIICNVGIRESQSKVIEAKHKVDIFSAAVTAVDHKRKGLESLVTLLIADYYSKPRAPKGSEDIMSHVEKEAVRRRGRREKT